MKEKVLKFALCVLDQEDRIVAKTDAITVQWDPCLEKEMNEMFNLNIQDELVNSITEELKRGIRPDTVSELIGRL